MIIKNNISLEDAINGVSHPENERTFYARMTTLNVLNTAAKVEQHEQWEIKFPVIPTINKKSRIRVRKTICNDETEYALVLKIDSVESKVGATMVSETGVQISKDFFNQMKGLSDRGMIKTRYCFDNTEIKGGWIEVDVFKLPNGKTGNWVKIDIEYDQGMGDEDPKLPEGFVDIISGTTQNPEQKEFISKLYDDLFLTKDNTI